MTTGSLKFGLSAHQEPLGRDMRQAFDEQLRVVHFIRDHGWNGFFTGQHFLTSGLSVIQAVPLLARLIPETGEMHIGMGVSLLALHHPVEEAEIFASIDVMSGGRLIYGVGLGYRDEEYDAFGIQRSQRVERFERNLETIKQLWAGEEVSVDLPWCRLSSTRLTTLPAQRPLPPIWVAANNDAAVLRAARVGDTWMINPHARSETLARQLELYFAERDSAGLERPEDLPLIREVFCARDRRTALEQAGPYLADKYRTYANWGQDKAMPGQESFDKPFEELLEDRFIIGSPDGCTQQLLWWNQQFGVNYFVLRTQWVGMPVETTLSSLALLSDEVIPAMRQAVG